MLSFSCNNMSADHFVTRQIVIAGRVPVAETDCQAENTVKLNSWKIKIPVLYI